MKMRFTFFPALLLLSGCISFTAVGPGEMNNSGLVVTTESAWNQAPMEMSRLLRPDSRSWTRNGMFLDRLIIIPAVASGEPVFRQTSQSQALPLFDSTMLPNEIEELTESSIVKLFGEGGAVVETANLRPHRFGNNRGVMFDLEVSVSDGPDYGGLVGAMIVDNKLNLVIFLGAKPHYYEALIEQVTRIIEDTRVTGAS